MGSMRGNLVLPNIRPQQGAHYHDKSYHKCFGYVASPSYRGAMFPALKATGLSDAAIRRAWVAFRKGTWQIDVLLHLWREYVMGLKGWQEHRYEGYVPVTVDITVFWRLSCS
jgi:hypothetical protein